MRRQGREFTWHGPSSCTKRISALGNPEFLGTCGPRTQFIIQLTQGQARDITRYSLIPTEEEVLLPPGCRFRVEDVLPLGAGLTQIQLVELPSTMWILDISRSSSSLGFGASQPTVHCTQLARGLFELCLVNTARGGS